MTADNANMPNMTNVPDLFAFSIRQEEAYRSQAHHHLEGQLFFLISGLVIINVGESSWVMPPGAIGWVPPNCVHSAHSYGPTAGYSSYFSPQLCRHLPEQPAVMKSSDLIPPLIARIAELDPTQPRTPPQQRLIDVLLDELQVAPNEPLRLPFPADRRLAAIAHALMDQVADNRDLPAWARWAGISARSISRKFVEETGMTFAQWRQMARLVKALEWLAEGRPVTDVGLSLGYDSVSAFIAAFKRHFGKTPGAYFTQATEDKAVQWAVPLWPTAPDISS